MASLRSDGSRPATPWRPSRLHVYGVYRRERQRRERAPGSSNRTRAALVRYDVRFQVDGHEFRYGFDKKGLADLFADQLHEQFVLGHDFDPAGRRFVEPEKPAPNPTFSAHAVDHFRRMWSSWSPARRRDAQHVLARACIELVRPDTPVLSAPQRLALESYLKRRALTTSASGPLTTEDRRWTTWLERWSLPLGEVTDVHLHEFLEAVRTTDVRGRSRLLSPVTLIRFRAVVRQAFKAARRRRLIEWDPWEAVEWKPPAADELDGDLVMDPAQVVEVAAACGAIHRQYECFVLIQGLCGLRPGEARELRRRDLDLASTPATVTVRGSHSEVPERFFDDGETPERPLKGRGQRASRTIPIPSTLVPRLEEHLNEFVANGPDALVCTTLRGKRIRMTNFYRDIWKHALASVFEDDAPLRRTHTHDLRHSAITTWLNSGVMLKTAQRWSGHRTASVLLNTYLGVMRDDAAVSLARVEDVVAEAFDRPVPCQASDTAHGIRANKESARGEQ